MKGQASVYDDYGYRPVGPRCPDCGGPILSDEGVKVSAAGLAHATCSQLLRLMHRAWTESVKTAVLT
jgi:hypothetical protein